MNNCETKGAIKELIVNVFAIFWLMSLITSFCALLFIFFQYPERTPKVESILFWASANVLAPLIITFVGGMILAKSNHEE